MVECGMTPDWGRSNMAPIPRLDMQTLGISCQRELESIDFNLPEEDSKLSTTEVKIILRIVARHLRDVGEWSPEIVADLLFECYKEISVCTSIPLIKRGCAFEIIMGICRSICGTDRENLEFIFEVHDIVNKRIQIYSDEQIKITKEAIKIFLRSLAK